MNSQDGIKGPELEPTNEKLAECRIRGAAKYEASDVRGPVGNARNGKIQSSRNLPPEAEPIGIDIAGPGGDPVSLRSSEGGAREDIYPLLVGRGTLAIGHGSGRQHREEVDITIAATCRQLMAELDVVFLPFGLRFGRIHPPGIEADAEEALIHLIPVVFASFGVGRVVHRHGVGVVGRLSIFELVDEPALLVHVVVIDGAGLEEWPDRNHEVEILLVQPVDHALGIGIVLVEDELALAIPPEPVLDDIVDGNMQLTIFRGHTENFILRLVAILALPETVRPLAEHRDLSGQLAIAGDDLVDFGTVEKVVVDDVGDLRTDIEVIGKAIIETASCGAVPEDPIAAARDQKRHSNVGIVLRNINRLAAVIPNASLVLSETVQSFARAIDVDERLCAIGVLPVHSDGSQFPGGLLDKLFPGRIAVRDRAVLARDHRFHTRSRYRDFVVVRFHLPIDGRPAGLDHNGIKARWK